MTHAEIVGRLSHRLVEMARRAGATCIAVACPLCQVNLDMRQADARKKHGALPETPVFYITQLLGLALGLSPQELGLSALSISPDGLLQKLPAPVAKVAAGEGQPHSPCCHLAIPPSPDEKSHVTAAAGGNR
jgi:heterodisulfide reductase subunit B